MSNDKIIKQIKRLIYASDSFQKIEALIEHMESPDTKINETLYSAMISSVVTTYAVNFNQADGVGPLPKMYEEFDDRRIKEAHNRLLDARNQLYAHRDIHSTKKTTEKAYKVVVWLQDGMLLQRPYMIDISSGKLPEIKVLIAFQRSRLQADLDGKLAQIIDPSKDYKEGQAWELGVDFP
ncbi:hypothetical protein [Vreelandella venusta]|uniref:hypothetical protein n=1 Tax=Vreelandella venusta TaxID=44935 RepID=UPI003F670772